MNDDDKIDLPRCPACSADVDAPHKPGCDVERCSVCGLQRIGCRCYGHDPSFARWSGHWPGALECAARKIDLNEFYQQRLHEAYFIKKRPWLWYALDLIGGMLGSDWDRMVAHWRESSPDLREFNLYRVTVRLATTIYRQDPKRRTIRSIIGARLTADQLGAAILSGRKPFPRDPLEEYMDHVTEDESLRHPAKPG